MMYEEPDEDVPAVEDEDLDNEALKNVLLSIRRSLGEQRFKDLLTETNPQDQEDESGD